MCEPVRVVINALYQGHDKKTVLINNLLIEKENYDNLVVVFADSFKFKKRTVIKLDSLEGVNINFGIDFSQISSYDLYNLNINMV